LCKAGKNINKNNIMNNKMLKVDLKDRKILYELDYDSRQSLSKIGKKVGLHKNVVLYRIKRLENLGIISFYQNNALLFT